MTCLRLIGHSPLQTDPAGAIPGRRAIRRRSSVIVLVGVVAAVTLMLDVALLGVRITVRAVHHTIACEHVAVFFRPPVDPIQQEKVRRVLEALPRAGPLRFVDQREAFAEFHALQRRKGRTVPDELQASDMPPSYRLIARRNSRLVPMEAELKAGPSVLDVIAEPAFCRDRP